MLEPASGRLTGADTGKGRMPEADEIARHCQLLLRRPDALPYDLAGLHVVVSAGGTREPLDPVRFLGNASSGKQGYALAAVAAARGARVTLVAANCELPDPAAVDVVRVGSAAELRDAVHKAAAEAAVVVMAAAVADFRPVGRAGPQDQEVRRRAADRSTSSENPDILARTGRRTAGPARCWSDSRPRPATPRRRCSTTAAPNWPARAATCSS